MYHSWTIAFTFLVVLVLQLVNYHILALIVLWVWRETSWKEMPHIMLSYQWDSQELVQVGNPWPIIEKLLSSFSKGSCTFRFNNIMIMNPWIISNSVCRQFLNDLMHWVTMCGWTFKMAWVATSTKPWLKVEININKTPRPADPCLLYDMNLR